MRAALAVLVLAFLCAPPGLAQEPSPYRIVGGLLMMFLIADECDIEVSPERREAMAAAGERLQAKAGIPAAEIEAIAAQTARDIKGADCTQARASFDAVAADLLAQAGRVP